MGDRVQIIPEPQVTHEEQWGLKQAPRKPDLYEFAIMNWQHRSIERLELVAISAREQSEYWQGRAEEKTKRIVDLELKDHPTPWWYLLCAFAFGVIATCVVIYFGWGIS